MENNENQNPKSLGRIGYHTVFKENIQSKNNISVRNKKDLPRTPLKSKMNLLNTNPQPLDTKDSKCLKYPLLKSISSSNINNNNKFQNPLNNNNSISEEENDTYNENALEDEPEDFMHMNQNEICLNNDDENENDFILERPKLKVEILNEFNPFSNYGNNNYALGAHFDEDGKKQFDDYFNSPDEKDLDDSDS